MTPRSRWRLPPGSEFNAAFGKHWKEKTGKNLSFSVSHGATSRPARAVIDGLEADVVILALAGAGLLLEDWQSRLPENSAPSPRSPRRWSE